MLPNTRVGGVRVGGSTPTQPTPSLASIDAPPTADGNDAGPALREDGDTVEGRKSAPPIQLALHTETS